jgi:outer membrane protein assembly factor BamE (lipoprotein component of BamABCDE complex)
MIITQNNLPSFFLIGILLLFLSSCTFPTKKYLVLDASLVQKGQTREEIVEFFGPPHAERTNPAGQEELYYYDVKRHFWHNIPFLGGYLGKKEVECLQIVLESGKVVKAIYYVQRLQDKV